MTTLVEVTARALVRVEVQLLFLPLGILHIWGQRVLPALHHILRIFHPNLHLLRGLLPSTCPKLPFLQLLHGALSYHQPRLQQRPQLKPWGGSSSSLPTQADPPTQMGDLNQGDLKQILLQGKLLRLRLVQRQRVNQKFRQTALQSHPPPERPEHTK